MKQRNIRTPTGVTTTPGTNERFSDFLDRQLVRVQRSIRLTRSPKRDELDAERSVLLADRFTTKERVDYKDGISEFVPDEIQVTRKGSLHADAHGKTLAELDGDLE